MAHDSQTSPANLEACLPTHLRGSATSISRIAAGWSGAGVYRIETNGEVLVLKVSSDTEPISDWRRKLRIRQLAAAAGVAPPVVHADESRRAVLSPFIVDRGFIRFFRDPLTHEAALALLGRTLRRVHDLSQPVGATSSDARALLAGTWSALDADAGVPSWVREAVRGVLAEAVLPSERATVLSHNDVNPSNLLFDGTNLLLVDWDVAGANNPFFDLSAISVFLRMDDQTCRRLLAAYDGAAGGVLPPAFSYHRRLVAALCGANLLTMARRSGYEGAAEAPLSGPPNLATGEGQWLFGLALIRTGFGL